ncbi:MAG TPA: aminoglycoside 6-adenylyltransferase [Ktedonobacterales bacterium]
MDHPGVLQHIVEWVRSEPNIRAAVLTGSVARDGKAADAEADLDVELYVTNPSLLLEDDAWYHQFGEVLVVEALENPGWHPTRLVYYAEGKIDFMIAPVTILAGGVAYDRSFRVLLDKDGVASAFQRTTPTQGQPPTASEFMQCIQWFYAATIMWAKYLARGDPWAAKQRDWDSKTQLLTMLEWDHKARKGWDYDTWYLGVHLREWVDADLLDPIEACWSGFSRQDSLRALWASLALFDLLSARTATALGAVPYDATRIRQRIGHLLNVPK